jgi:hypothetical protein
LFHKITHAITLQQQMRAAEDIHYVQVLDRLRNRVCTIDDYEFLNSKIIQNNPSLNINSPEWINCPIITPLKKLGFYINNLMAYRHSLMSGRIHHVICAYDLVKSERVRNSRIRDAIIEQTTMPKGNRYHYRTIELSIGSKVVLTKNIKHLAEYGLTNGCPGTVVGIVPNPKLKYDVFYSRNIALTTGPPIILFKPDRPDPILNTFVYPGLSDPGIIPIFPDKQSFKISVPIGDNYQSITVTRHQLPMTGGYALTCYKAQGSTYTNAIIDLASITAAASPYVSLSRLKSSKGLLILRPFPRSNLTRPFDKNLNAALTTLNELEQKHFPDCAE